MLPMLITRFAPMLVRIAPHIIAGILVFAVGYALIQHGRGIERDAQVVQELKTYEKTTEAVNAVRPSPDRSAAVKRLRANGWTR